MAGIPWNHPLGSPKRDMAGWVSGSLIALHRVPTKRQPYGGRLWECLCVCGNRKNLTEGQLLSLRHNSCGCLQRSSNRRCKSHRMSNTPTYRSWSSARCRVVNPKHHAYARYGGSGVKMCGRWLESFEAFYADMGERPHGTSLDRIDRRGDYEPGNCRWATPKEQANNRMPYGTFTRASSGAGDTQCGHRG